MANIKELTTREDRLAGGHRLCAGCGASIAVRQVLLGAGETPVVAGCATGCLEVSTTIYPYTVVEDPVHPQRVRELRSDRFRRRGRVQGPEGAPARSRPTRR